MCDWCRLLWVYRDSFDKELLERRLIIMGLMTEWWSFSELAICYLGLPMEAMPLCNNRGKWKRKSNRILSFIMETGNFGHTRDLSYRQVSSATRRRFETFLHISSDTIKRYSIFPFDSLRVWCLKMMHGLKMVKTEAFE